MTDYENFDNLLICKAGLSCEKISIFKSYLLQYNIEESDKPLFIFLKCIQLPRSTDFIMFEIHAWTNFLRVMIPNVEIANS